MSGRPLGYLVVVLPLLFLGVLVMAGLLTVICTSERNPPLRWTRFERRAHHHTHVYSLGATCPSTWERGAAYDPDVESDRRKLCCPRKLTRVSPNLRRN